MVVKRERWGNKYVWVARDDDGRRLSWVNAKGSGLTAQSARDRFRQNDSLRSDVVNVQRYNGLSVYIYKSRPKRIPKDFSGNKQLQLKIDFEFKDDTGKKHIITGYSNKGTYTEFEQVKQAERMAYAKFKRDVLKTYDETYFSGKAKIKRKSYIEYRPQKKTNSTAR